MEDHRLVFHELAGWSLLEEPQEESVSKIEDTLIVQPAVSGDQAALVKLYDTMESARAASSGIRSAKLRLLSRPAHCRSKMP